MMGWSPKCYIPSFMKIGLSVLEKKIFECFFTIYERGGHLGHVTWIPLINFRLPYPWMLHIKVRLVSEKKIFEKCVWTTVWPRSRDDLDLYKSHTFIHSISCLHLPLFRPRAAIVFKKIHSFHFFLCKSLCFQFDLAVK